MHEQHVAQIAAELGLRAEQVVATIELIDAGGTVPFIARYRKEATGLLDEVAITDIRDRLQQLRELDGRRETILKSLEEQEVLSDELRDKVTAAKTLSALEDIYLPHRPKRRTRATIAREKGLEPLAELVFVQADDSDPLAAAEAYIDAACDVADGDTALAGARDIIAEWINENPEARAEMRDLYENYSILRSRVIADKEQEGSKYRDYFEWEEPLAKAPSHPVLAIRRGEKEGCLSMRVFGLEDQCLAVLDRLAVKAGSAEEKLARVERAKEGGENTEKKQRAKARPQKKSCSSARRRSLHRLSRTRLLAMPCGKPD